MDKNINLDEFVKYLQDEYDPCNICNYDDLGECDQWDPPQSGMGRIIVTSVLCCEDGEPLEDVEIELYLINDCKAPGFKLIDCKSTDKEGKVVFRCLNSGSYAIREVVPDNCLIPKYDRDFRIELTANNPEGRITVINLPPRKHHKHQCNC